MSGRMRILGIVLIVLVVTCLPLWWWFWCRCGPTTTMLIIRHADRDGTADALNAAGVARAQELVHLGEKSNVAAIYRSDTNRARDTAAPLATALGLTPIVYPSSNTADLVHNILADHAGQAVLVVGHSNTVPRIITAAGGPNLPDITDNEFDNLFVLKTCLCRGRRATVVNLQYGAASP